jgi:hypothetical protein
MNNPSVNMEDGEEFTISVMEVTCRVLVSFTGWQEISDETQKLAAASNIFRLAPVIFVKLKQDILGRHYSFSDYTRIVAILKHGWNL